MTHRKLLLIIPVGLLVVCFGLAGCTIFKATGLQMGLVIDGQEYERVGYFSEDIWTNKFLGWTLNGGTLFDLTSDATNPKVRELIETQIRRFGGDGAVDVEISYGPNALQFFIGAFTLGTWMPETVTVSGTVVKAVK
jgi:hypothetical protein